MYKNIIIKSQEFLITKGVTPKIQFGLPLTVSEINDFENEFKFKIPDDLLQLYSELGSGFSFQWEDSIDENCNASFILIGIDEIIKDKREIRDGVWGNVSESTLKWRKNKKSALYSIDFMRRCFVFLKWPDYCDYLSYNIDLGTIHCDENAEWENWNINFISPGINQLFIDWGNVCFQMPGNGGFSDWIAMNGAQMWGDNYKYKINGF